MLGSQIGILQKLDLHSEHLNFSIKTRKWLAKFYYEVSFVK